MFLAGIRIYCILCENTVLLLSNHFNETKRRLINFQLPKNATSGFDHCEFFDASWASSSTIAWNWFIHTSKSTKKRVNMNVCVLYERWRHDNKAMMNKMVFWFYFPFDLLSKKGSDKLEQSCLKSCSRAAFGDLTRSYNTNKSEVTGVNVWISIYNNKANARREAMMRKYVKDCTRVG